MSAVEPALHALYSRAEEVLGRDHAETLMTHLLQHRADEAATKSDIADLRRDFDARFEGIDARFEGIDARFDRLEDRFDRLEERMDGTCASLWVPPSPHSPR
jgi:hypothetical protein